MTTSPIPIATFDASDQDVRTAVTLPPAAYTSPEFFEFEKDAVFYREWLCIGRAEQVPEPGDYLGLEIVGEPIVMVRDHDGDVAVFSSVCRHRNVVIVEGEGNCGRNLRCPYHWWTYGLDGKLRGAPEMQQTEGFDKEEIALPRIKTEIWNGFVFINFDNDAAPLAPRLRKFDALLANYHASELVTSPQFHYDMPWNWKIMLENGTEHYHAVFLHSKFIVRGSEDSSVPPWEGENDSAIISIVPVPVPDLGLSPHGGTYWPPIPTLTEEERKRFVFSAVPPNLHIGLQGDLMFWFMLLPVAPDRTLVRWAYCVPKDVIERPQFDSILELVHRGVENFNDEDFPINASMQRGLRSRLAGRGRMSVEEETAAHVARWVIQRYRAEDARAATAL